MEKSEVKRAADYRKNIKAVLSVSTFCHLTWFIDVTENPNRFLKCGQRIFLLFIKQSWC